MSNTVSNRNTTVRDKLLISDILSELSNVKMNQKVRITAGTLYLFLERQYLYNYDIYTNFSCIETDN